MEETKSYNLILSLSGYEYNAPDNGYFVLSTNAVKVGEQIKLGDNEPIVAKEENESLTSVCKALKGDKVKVEYTTTGNINFFKFIVAPVIEVMAAKPMLTQLNVTLPMDKPTKPTSNMPSSFGGVKNDFSDELKANGYEYDKPAVLGGDNLNFLIDSIGSTVQYYTAITDYFCSIDPEKTPVVDYANRLSQTEFAFKVYDSNEIYGADKTVVAIDENKTIRFYVSLQNGNQGHALTEGEWWIETGFTVPPATTERLGVVKVDDVTVKVSADGILSIPIDDSTIKVIDNKIALPLDNDTIKLINGKISTAGVASLDKAGSVKPDGDTTTVDSDGTIHANGTAIGDPILTLSSTLGENEIWLEGASVSKTTYAKLFAIYGTTYGTSTDTNFTLPDFRNRALWGSNGFGYQTQTQLTVSIPYNGYARTNTRVTTAGAIVIGSGSGEVGETLESLTEMSSNRVLNISGSIIPNGIKIRVKTRYA